MAALPHTAVAPCSALRYSTLTGAALMSELSSQSSASASASAVGLLARGTSCGAGCERRCCQSMPSKKGCACTSAKSAAPAQGGAVGEWGSACGEAWRGGGEALAQHECAQQLRTPARCSGTLGHCCCYMRAHIRPCCPPWHCAPASLPPLRPLHPPPHGMGTHLAAARAPAAAGSPPNPGQLAGSPPGTAGHTPTRAGRSCTRSPP